jgi:predicted nucleic acid-binding protein
MRNWPMRIEKVVVNSSPLIVLFRSGQADLLPQLFTDIVVPELVYQEVLAGRMDDVAKMALPQTLWINRKRVEITLPVAAWNLGNGESAVFSFAMKESGYRAVVDDLTARRCAQAFEIKTLGTGGLLVLAKRRGLIESVTDRVQRIRDAGLWLSDAVVQLLITEAGE